MTGPISTKACKAAANAPDNAAGDCPKCDNHGLVLFLTRPCATDHAYTQANPGFTKALTAGLTLPALQTAGYAMRTLRAGYVMLYFQDDHAVTVDAAAQDGWRVYRVDDAGYLTPTRFATTEAGKDKSEPFACSRTSGYAGGMLLTIPFPKQAKRVWIGFASHPWSKPVRDGFVEDETLRQSAMTLVHADTAKCDRSVPLTAANLAKATLDFTPNLPHEALQGNPFPRRLLGSDDNLLSLVPATFPALRNTFSQKVRPESAADIHAKAETAMSGPRANGMTIDNALIIGLPDAEGCTTETAQRRVTLCNSAADWIAGFKDDKGVANGYWRLQCALSVKGLLQVMATPAAKDAAEHEKFDQSLNLTTMDRTTFERLQHEGKLPPDAALVSDQFNESKMAQHPIDHHPAFGRVVMPSPDGIRHASVARMTDVLEKLDGKARGMNWQKFLDTYDNKTKADKAQLDKVEKDYHAWIGCEARKQLTTHQFDTKTRADGLPYARCVNYLTLGGPITENGVTWFTSFLSGNPNDKDAILTRALLGNQTDFFEWFAEVDQKARTLDEVKGILDLQSVEEAKDALAHKLAAWREVVEQRHYVAQALMITANATSAGLLKAGQMSKALSQRLQALTRMLIAKAAGTGADAPQLMKLRVPFNVATHLSHAMLNVAEPGFPSNAQAGSRPVRSLVLSPSSMLETLTGRNHADVLTDVYVLARGLPSDKLDALLGRGHYALAADSLKTGGPWSKIATKIDLEGARMLVKQSMTVIKEVSGVLSAGSAWLGIFLGVEAVEKFRNGTEEDRRSAALAFVSSGLVVSASLLEIRGAFAKAAEKELVESGIKRAAGYASGVALIIDGVAAFVAAGADRGRGDTDARVAHDAQGIFFIGAGATAIATAYAAGEVGSAFAGTLLGLSATGWGLLLVALGVIAGFVAIALKDTPAQTWAAESIWGTASDRFHDLDHEQSGLNSVLMGAQINFNYRSVLSDSANWTQGDSGTAEMTGAFQTADTIQTREAWLQIILPKAVMDGARWRMKIMAGRGRATQLIATRGSETAPVGTQGDPQQNIISITYGVKALGEEPSEGEDAEGVSGEKGLEGAAGAASVVLTLSATLDALFYTTARGFVEIYASKDEDADLLVDEIL